MFSFVSLIDVLQSHAKNFPTNVAIKFVTSAETHIVTYEQLDQRSRALAALLQSKIPMGERALILLPAGLDYIIAFFACLYAGVVAVPAYPPRKNTHNQRINTIFESAQASWVILNKHVEVDFSEINLLVIGSMFDDPSSAYKKPVIDSNSIAFLQYTSGSISNPKGIMISHACLMANLETMKHALNIKPEDTGCSWLPPYHDMGLIGGILSILYVSAELILMSPSYFFQNPLRWLEIISEEQVSITVAPNFAFLYCVNKIPVHQRKHLNLSGLKLMLNGSESVSWETMQQFISAFSSVGFKPQVFFPCYGLAEGTLFLAGGHLDVNSSVLALDREAYENGRIEIYSPQSNKSVVNVVSCGRPAPKHELCIVDLITRKCLAERIIGEIWVYGPSIAKGYWSQSELTKEVFQAELSEQPGRFYLRTGDLGFIDNGQLYVTGRLKELIIMQGLNYYPQDIEMSLSEIEELEFRGITAFGVEIQGTQQLVILSEIKRQELRHLNADAVFAKIRGALLNKIGIIPYAIVLVKPYTLPKTSSGKMRRGVARDAYLNQQLQIIAESTSLPQSVDCSTNSIRVWLNDWLLHYLNIPLALVDSHQSVAELGLNSIAIAEFAYSFQKNFSQRLEWSSDFEQCTINNLIEKLSLLVLEDHGTQVMHNLHSSELLNEEFKKDNQRFLNLRDEQKHESTITDHANMTRLKSIYFQVNEGISEHTTCIAGKEYINYSGYNYLGLSGDQRVIQAVVDAVQQFGTSVSASRLVSGEKSLHLQLEAELANVIGTEASVVMSSGYGTNIAILTHLLSRQDLVIYDALSHNSIVRGILFSGAKQIAFPHQDYDFLTTFLEKYRTQYKNVLMVTEGIFSMDGDIANIPKLIEIKNRFQAQLMIDEAHSMGVLGKTGSGIREYYHLNPNDVDIWMGTLSKSFASCGGYIAGKHELIERFKYSSPDFIFSAGISPANTAAALAAIQVMKLEPQRVKLLHQRHTYMLELLKKYSIPIGVSQNTPIIPIIVGDASIAIEVSELLKERQILALPIVYPAVEKGHERIRLFLNCLHTEEQINYTVESLLEIVKSVTAYASVSTQE